jgi:hypothetical protein
MQLSVRRLAVAAVTAMAVAVGSMNAAQAAWGGHWGGGHWGGGHWGGGSGGFWPGFAGGIAVGAVASSPYWGAITDHTHTIRSRMAITPMLIMAMATTAMLLTHTPTAQVVTSAEAS